MADKYPNTLAGDTDRLRNAVSKLRRSIVIAFKADFAWIWRLGLIDRTTAFRWEVDSALNEKENTNDKKRNV